MTETGSGTRTHGLRGSTQQASSATCDVCIVNYNAGPLLGACLRSLAGAPVGRVFVVDNASRDASVAAVEGAFRGLDMEIVRNPRNMGFAAACNIAIARSRAARILFLNPDATVEPGTVARLAEVLDSAPDIAMAGALICNPDGTEQPGGRRRFPIPSEAFAKAFGLASLSRAVPYLFRIADFDLHHEPLPSAPTDVAAISGSCMMVDRAAIDVVGAWDEGYFLHCEDLDWCMRVHGAGLRVVFVPDARAVHVRGGCSRDRPLAVEWHKHRGMLRFYGKFHRAVYPAPLWPLVAAGVWVHFGAVVGLHLARRLAGRRP